MAFNGLGVYCWFKEWVNPEYKMSCIKETGYDCISLWWGDEYEKKDGNRYELFNLACRYGLKVRNVHAPYPGINFIWGPECSECDHIIKLYSDCLAECARYNIETLIIHIDDIGFLYDDVYKSKAIGRIRFLTDLAEKLGVRIAIENYTSFRSIWEILSNISSPKLGFCYDCGHEHCFTKNYDMLKVFGSRLFEIHLHDNDGISDQHLLPQDGSINWEHVKAELIEIDYIGPVFLEITNTLSDKYKNISIYDFLLYAANRAKFLYNI